MKKGFDNSKYIHAQVKAIKKRAKHFHRLYLEIGGRLTYDGHASRVLPGYDPENKLKVMRKMHKEIEVLYCISAKKLQKGTKWSNTGLTLDKLAIKETKLLKKNNIKVLGIVATLFKGEKKVIAFGEKLAKKGIPLYITTQIKKYPQDMKEIFGEMGFAAQEYVLPTKKIVIVAGAGANSGKMFNCLKQVYFEDKAGLDTGYAKWETFPIWDLPITHEVNIAYEAATAGIRDKIEIDPFHKKTYGITAVNYNRDIESFPVLHKIITNISKKNNYMHTYHSPTDMGINMARIGIVDDKICRDAGRKEILQRMSYYQKNLKGEKKRKTLKRMHEILAKIQ